MSARLAGGGPANLSDATPTAGHGAMSMFERIDHVSVQATDYDSARRFYQEVLGFTLFSEKALGGTPPRRIGYLRPPHGDAVIELVEQVGSGGTGYHYCLEVDDFAAAFTRLTG